MLKVTTPEISFCKQRGWGICQLPQAHGGCRRRLKGRRKSCKCQHQLLKHLNTDHPVQGKVFSCSPRRKEWIVQTSLQTQDWNTEQALVRNGYKVNTPRCTISIPGSTWVASPAPNPLVNREASLQTFPQVKRWRSNTNNALADNVRPKVMQYQSSLDLVTPPFLYKEKEGSWETYPEESPGNMWPTESAHTGTHLCSTFALLRLRK